MQKIDNQHQHASTILIVDDEVHVLSALKRCLRNLECQIYTATSGAEGLQLLGQVPVDLVISDMRMPEMDGAQFLEQVNSRCPNTTRFLCTGYADLDATIAAINKGSIHSYINKPWDDRLLKLAVRDALEKSTLRKEKEKLEKLTIKQNMQLRDANENLECHVEQRTIELQKALKLLKKTYEKLDDSYSAAIPVFATLVELREKRFAGHCRRVSDYAARMCQQLKLPEQEQKNICFAALLHNIGKIGLSDELCHRSYFSMNKAELDAIHEHPIIGETALLALPAMTETAKLIRHQHELVNGSGYPDRLSREHIPLGARILSIVIDYDEIQLGLLLSEKVSPDGALAYLQKNKGKRYDSDLVDAFTKILEEDKPEDDVNEMKVSLEHAMPGMILSRDFVSANGMLLLAKGKPLSELFIEKIKALSRQSGIDKAFYVCQDEQR